MFNEVEEVKYGEINFKYIELSNVQLIPTLCRMIFILEELKNHKNIEKIIPKIQLKIFFLKVRRKLN